MARRRKKAESDNSLGYVVLFVIGLVILAMIPAWAWYTAFAGALAWGGWKLYSKNAGTKISGVPAADIAARGAVWVPAGRAITVDNLSIPGGFVYVGKSLPTRSGANDPALINTTKQIASKGDYTVDQMDYWPSYSEVSPEARRSYLQWLAGGRKDPYAEIGFVFLFFYGLERRAILDASSDDEAQDDWPVIAKELRRLLGIYGPQSKSFRRYANDLLTWVELGPKPAKLYERPVPEFAKGVELPMYVRFGLGQATLERAPVPPEFALAWALLEPGIKLPASAQRFRKEFRELFLQRYRDAFGQGMVLPVNRTKLRFTYRPASAGFRGYDDIKMGFGDIPDVSVLTSPVQQLQELVDAAAEALAPYSRFVGKNPSAATTQEALLLLPAPLWPASAQEPLRQLASRIKSGLLVQTFGEVLAVIGMTPPVAKAAAHNAARVLESFNIGMEPDILSGAKVPRTDDPVVLFTTQPGEQCNRQTPEYQIAALTLQLGSAVAMADGEMDISEFRHLRLHIEQWAGLTTAQQHRLRAHLRLLVAAPVSLTTLSKKLEPLDGQARQTLGRWLAEVSHADGNVSPTEVAALEKVYKALGIEVINVYSDVHAVAASSSNPTSSAPALELQPRDASPFTAKLPTPSVPLDLPSAAAPKTPAVEPVPVFTAQPASDRSFAIPAPRMPAPAPAPVAAAAPVAPKSRRRAAAAQTLAGMNIVITGVLSELRSHFVGLIEQAGGEVTETVSKKTSYLVAGVDPGAKLTRAQELGIPVIDEIGLRTLLALGAPAVVPVTAPAKPAEKAGKVAPGPAAEPAPAVAVAKKPNFQLDKARIAALQEDTARVSALLAKIFAEEPPPAPAVPEPVEAEPAEAEAAAQGLLGLDTAHSSFARMLLSRPHWSREELQDVASDLDLMLDGALEHINEASFDAHDEPLTEGDDPVTVNQHILEKVEA